MIRALFCLLLMTFSLPANATELSSRYTEMGRMTAQIGDQTLELMIPYDLEKDRGYAERKMIMGSFLTINTAARAVDEAGKPTSPTVQVTLQEQGGRLQLISAELFDEQGFDAPMVMGPDGGSGELTSHALDKDVLTAEVQGTFLRLTGYRSGQPKPADGASPVSGVIKWQVTLPPIE